MSINNDIVRIIKVDKLEGTFYFPQRKVWKFRIFSESRYEWESFFLVRNADNNCLSFVDLSEVKFNAKVLESYNTLKTAEYDCKEYIRINTDTDKIIKVWSVEN